MLRFARPISFLAIAFLFGLTACQPGDATSVPVASDSQPASAPKRPTTAGVDDIFADIAADAPGASVIVMKDGEIVHRADYGLANLDYGIPINSNTVFDIASISKQFGGMAALLLEADGALDLDADVRDYVPELPDFGYTITARHLLHHTSGIRDWPHVMMLAGVEYGDVISYEKILRMLFQQEAINFPPGSEYAYSNTGYNLLSLIIERTSGMTFREFTNERIFKPLGMTSTHFSDNSNEVIANRAESYQPVESGAPSGQYQRAVNQLTALASSSLHTTIDDFGLWMKNFESAQLGGQAIVERMTEQGVLTNGETIAYANGLAVGEYRDLVTHGHGGSWAGFRTNYLRFPDHGISIAVFCNFADCDPARRVRKVSEVFLGNLMGPPPPEQEAEPEKIHPILSEAELTAFNGSYRSAELDSTYRVFVRDGQLIAEHWRNAPAVLTPVAEDLFEGDQNWFPEVRFRRDDNGHVTALLVAGSRVRDLVFERMAADQ
ncbi:serine hydrolase domain-containing protein [Woeseia oceani]|uniref:Beta-lactamase-related domain-containing protein n=1 Tax=Woeseia oceani TaxID=1548547 RepID=A0A193LJY4_9GAMM|nr:serine hydrolase domain-containing protein [Woeseia oceani]ANO52766.1 hypothetical protein BA177_17620 [Woeseia oceani]